MSKFRKLLVIDDSELDRVTLQKIAEKNGYAVVTASDGPEGIDRPSPKSPTAFSWTW